MQTLEDYSRRFKDADASWPDLPFTTEPRVRWWETWLEGRDAAECWDDLRQILLMQRDYLLLSVSGDNPGQRETDRWLECLSR